MTNKPLILVTNDDSIYAPGIRALIGAMTKLGEVIVVAPDKPNSGVGHAITINATLRLHKMDLFDGVEAYACTGTPVDCVKMAMDVVLDRKPDLVVSGINHGSNSSINVLYSGTMSAAMEGGLECVPSVGFSLLDHAMDADFSAAAHFAEVIGRKMLGQKLPQHTCLNVNIPRLKLDEIAGIKVARQAAATWEEDFDERKDPNGGTYYWLTGKFINLDDGDDTDEQALKENFVSIVPIQCDLTAYAAMDQVKGIFG